MPLAEGVRKITDLPARRFGIAQRGRLERGCFADITVFDPREIASAAPILTQTIPRSPPPASVTRFATARRRRAAA